ncbi:MAG: FmdB family zinc ribbon protein [Cellvibrionaceae bacterium]
MPIYEYSCTECEHELEALQKMSDDPLTDCPQCGKPALVKKISAAAFRLSGSGWYETDFKSGKKKNLAGDAGKSDSSTSSSGAKKTDSQPSTKTSSSSAKAG